MDPQQREHFRANGWIVVKDVLSQGTVAAANELYDGHLDGSLTAHPDDVGWDGGLTTRESDMWYNAGQARPAEERHNRQRVLWGEPFYEIGQPAQGPGPPVFTPTPHPCRSAGGCAAGHADPGGDARSGGVGARLAGHPTRDG